MCVFVNTFMVIDSDFSFTNFKSTDGSNIGYRIEIVMIESD